jgi:hypothetical protein
MQINYADLEPQSLASEYWDTVLGDRFASLKGIKLDIQIVRQVAQRLQQEIEEHGTGDQVLLESLTWHIVLRYARCFDSHSEGRRANLSRDHLRGLAADLMTLHEGLWQRRSKTFAHAGDQCSYRSIVHLMPPADAQHAHIHVTTDLESPGPIVDPQQAALIMRLCDSIEPVIDRLQQGAWTNLSREITDKGDAVTAKLREAQGRHANVEQQALSVLRKV